MTEEMSGLCAYTDGSQLRLAYILGIEKKKARALIFTGRELLLPLKNFLFAFKAKVSEDEFRQSCKQYEEKIKSLSDEIELPVLWEMLNEEEQKKFNLDELSEFYFSDAGDYERAALFDLLLKDIVYFKRRGIEFTIRDGEQVEAILRSQQKKREKEAYEAELGPWVESVLNAPKNTLVEVPEKFSSFTGQLCNLIWHKSSSEASRFLDRLIGKAPLRLKAVDFLKKTGNISAELDEHLVMAGIHPSFSEKLEEAAGKLAHSAEIERRRLGEHFFCFSIDDDSTKDVDDVLSIEQLDNGNWRVGVHIADVSAYVPKGSELDEEAMRRATSIYLPTGTVNMFPASLSTEKFSLLPEGERPAVSYYTELNDDAEVLGFEVERSLICVQHKLSYSFCDEVLSDSGSEVEARLANDLMTLNELAQKLAAHRDAKGAFSFNRPEHKITVTDGQVEVKEVRANSLSRALVGEYMILANSQAAAYCHKHEIPILYRVQEKSDKAIEMPREYDPVAFDKAVKSLKKSKMTLYPGGHAGLGVEAYTQFTSPIRRFTDLVMQRQLLAGIEKREFEYSEDSLREILSRVESSLGEVRDVQRQSENFWLLTYLKQNKLGEVYASTVVAQLNGGLLVELDALGLRLKLNHGEKLAVGSRLEVKVSEVNPKLGNVKLTFEKLIDGE